MVFPSCHDTTHHAVLHIQGVRCCYDKDFESVKLVDKLNRTTHHHSAVN